MCTHLRKHASLLTYLVSHILLFLKGHIWNRGRAFNAHFCACTCVTACAQILGGEHGSLGNTWVDFRGLHCHSQWQWRSLADPKRKHFVGENGHFLSVNGPSKPCRSAPWIIHPSLRPHNVFCRAFLCRSSPLPFFLSDWIINRLPSSLAATKAVSKLAFCPRAAQAWAPNRLSRFCLPSSSLSVPLCARGVSLWGDGNRWTNVWSTHLGDSLSPRTSPLSLLPCFTDAERRQWTTYREMLEKMQTFCCFKCLKSGKRRDGKLLNTHLTSSFLSQLRLWCQRWTDNAILLTD